MSKMSRRTARSLLRALVRGAAVMVAAQLATIGALVAADARRKRTRPQGMPPRARLDAIAVGTSEVRVYTDGETLYAAMVEAIRGARERILFETFIWKDDAWGQRVKEELERAAARGVAVYITFDGFANLVVPRRFKRFAPSPRLHVLEYPLLPWPWHPLHLRSLARDHRKILVVDGHTAFTGGYNIGSLYAAEWRDTHLRVTGPQAWEIENVFIDFWNAHRRARLGRRLPELPNPHARSWDPHIAVHRNSPPLLMFPIRATYLEAIDRAQRHVYLTHAYFIPDRVILSALLDAAARGVDVCVLLPKTSNHVVADWLARGYYDACLAGRVRLLRYGAMVHAKTATIDGEWSTVGTANMDRLSMVGNFEVNVEIYDAAVARQMERIFAVDAMHARELTLGEWRRRPLWEKLAEIILLPLRPLL